MVNIFIFFLYILENLLLKYKYIYFIFFLKLDFTRRVNELEKDNAKLTELLTDINNKAKEQKSDDNNNNNNNSIDNNNNNNVQNNNYYTFKRITEIETELRVTKDVLKQLSLELTYFRNQVQQLTNDKNLALNQVLVVKSDEYKDLLEKHNQMMSLARRLESEKDVMEKEIKRLNETINKNNNNSNNNNNDNNNQGNDLRGTIDSLQNHLKISNELIEQLLSEQAKASHLQSNYEIQIKQLQQEINKLKIKK